METSALRFYHAAPEEPENSDEITRILIELELLRERRQEIDTRIRQLESMVPPTSEK